LVLYSYDAGIGGYRLEKDFLRVWHGYWLKAHNDCVLLLPEGRTSRNSYRYSKYPAFLGEKDFRLKISAFTEDGKFSDPYNYLGTISCDYVDDGFDRFDLAEPPNISPYVSLYFPHHDWKGYEGNYASDLRPSIRKGDLKVWNFSVSTDLKDVGIKILIEGLSSVPKDFKVVFQDIKSNRKIKIDPKVKFTYGPFCSSFKRDFRIRVSAERTFRSNDEGEVTVNVYPNPADTFVKFSVKLRKSKETQIYLKIYNLIGELILTENRFNYYDKSTQDFLYEYLWDLKNEKGTKVASGIYFYILKVESKNKEAIYNTKGKIIIVK
jgi:hypothetical protein